MKGHCCKNSDPTTKELFPFVFIFFWKSHLLFLSYYFTKKRPSKIFKIEKFNRQLIYKNGLIFTK